MMRIGTDLQDELLIEIGKFATTWAKIEQSIILDTIELSNLKSNHEDFDHLKIEFKRLRAEWKKLYIEAYDDSSHAKMMRLDQRMVNASIARGYVVHGVWEDTREDKQSAWKIKGGKDYRLCYWEQRGGKQYEYRTLPTGFDEVVAHRVKLEALYEDLLTLLNNRHLKSNFPRSVSKTIHPLRPRN